MNHEETNMNPLEPNGPKEQEAKMLEALRIHKELIKKKLLDDEI